MHNYNEVLSYYQKEIDNTLSEYGFDVSKLTQTQKDLIMQPLDAPEDYYQDGELSPQAAKANWIRKIAHSGLDEEDVKKALSIYEKKSGGIFDFDFLKNKRPKSALMRDRKYTSEQEWEQDYKRKGPVRRYKATGGEIFPGDSGYNEAEFKVEVHEKGQPQDSYIGNAIRFSSISDAESYGKDLLRKWTAIDNYRVVPTEGAKKAEGGGLAYGGGADNTAYFASKTNESQLERAKRIVDLINNLKDKHTIIDEALINDYGRFGNFSILVYIDMKRHRHLDRSLIPAIKGIIKSVKGAHLREIVSPSKEGVGRYYPRYYELDVDIDQLYDVNSNSFSPMREGDDLPESIESEYAGGGGIKTFKSGGNAASGGVVVVDVMYRDGANYKSFVENLVVPQSYISENGIPQVGQQIEIEDLGLTPERFYDMANITYDEEYDHNILDILDVRQVETEHFSAGGLTEKDFNLIDKAAEKGYAIRMFKGDFFIVRSGKGVQAGPYAEQKLAIAKLRELINDKPHSKPTIQDLIEAEKYRKTGGAAANEIVNIVYYKEVLDNWGKTESSSSSEKILSVLNDKENWTDDMSFKDDSGNWHSIDDLIGKEVTIHGKNKILIVEDFKTGGAANSGSYWWHGPGMGKDPRLASVSYDDLDPYEQMLYDDFEKHGHGYALQLIINQAEGDSTKLSEKLSKVLEAQSKEEYGHSKKNTLTRSQELPDVKNGKVIIGLKYSIELGTTIPEKKTGIVQAKIEPTGHSPFAKYEFLCDDGSKHFVSEFDIINGQEVDSPIEYKGVKYPTRKLVIDIDGNPSEVLIATESLQKELKKSKWRGEAGKIDETIYFYVPDNIMTQADDVVAKNLDDSFKLSKFKTGGSAKRAEIKKEISRNIQPATNFDIRISKKLAEKLLSQNHTLLKGCDIMCKELGNGINWGSVKKSDLVKNKLPNVYSTLEIWITGDLKEEDVKKELEKLF